MSRAKPGFVVGGRYRLVDKLGSGGFGQVWKARDQTLGVDVAVKEMWLPAAGGQEREQRLARAEHEARNAALLRDHHNIVDVHDVVIDDEIPWIVMRLVAGQSLEERIRTSGPLSVEDTAKVAVGLLNALGWAHEAGVIHRDVKPANVMVTDSGDVLLTDFGIAVHQADTALTATGSFVGSAEYIAPERIDGAQAQAASDLFSLGVTLYRAVEGISPFRRDTPTGTLRAVLLNQPPPPKRAGRLTRLITALMEKDPTRRPTVPQALSLAEAPPRPQPPPLPPPHPPGPGQRPGLKIAITAVAVAYAFGFVLAVGLGVFIGWKLTHDAPVSRPHPPSLTTPAERAVVSVGQPITLSWTDSAELAQVSIAYSRNGYFSAGDWRNFAWARTNRWTLTPNRPGIYLWRVASAHSGANTPVSGWSESRYLLVEPLNQRTIDLPEGTPPAPALTSPADQATAEVGQPITLTWRTSGGHSSVSIHSPGSGWSTHPWQSSTSYTFTPQAPGLYIWSVNVANGTGLPSGASEGRYLVVRAR